MSTKLVVSGLLFIATAWFISAVPTASPPRPKEPKGFVVVARRHILAGGLIRCEDLSRQEFYQSQIPQSAQASPVPFVGRLASQDIQAGTVITPFEIAWQPRYFQSGDSFISAEIAKAKLKWHLPIDVSEEERCLNRSMRNADDRTKYR